MYLNSLSFSLFSVPLLICRHCDGFQTWFALRFPHIRVFDAMVQRVAEKVNHGIADFIDDRSVEFRFRAFDLKLNVLAHLSR